MNYSALGAWGQMAAAFATFCAVIVALRQSAVSREDVRRQLRHQSWLEQQRIEEGQLARMLDAMHAPYEIAQDFYFSALRLLGSVPSNIAPPPGLQTELRSLL